MRHFMSSDNSWRLGQNMKMEKLVPGRECGTCDICCVALDIDTPEIRKNASTRCRHAASGCAIHAERPEVCRGFYCGWRLLPMIPPDWRPDQKGVFVQVEAGLDLPPQFRVRIAVNFMLVADADGTVRQAWFQEHVARTILGGVPVFLSLPPPKGHMAPKLMLNTMAMRDAALSREHVRIQRELEVMLAALRVAEAPPYAAQYNGPLMDAV